MKEMTVRGQRKRENKNESNRRLESIRRKTDRMEQI